MGLIIFWSDITIGYISFWLDIALGLISFWFSYYNGTSDSLLILQWDVSASGLTLQWDRSGSELTFQWDIIASGLTLSWDISFCSDITMVHISFWLCSWRAVSKCKERRWKTELRSDHVRQGIPKTSGNMSNTKCEYNVKFTDSLSNITIPDVNVNLL
jgi:hypothetical protein